MRNIGSTSVGSHPPHLCTNRTELTWERIVRDLLSPVSEEGVADGLVDDVVRPHQLCGGRLIGWRCRLGGRSREWWMIGTIAHGR